MSDGDGAFMRSDPGPALPPAPSPFRSPLWASGPHTQTLMARVLRPARGPATTRERLDTPDDDFVDVDWTDDPVPAAPIVIVLHGLEGSSRRRYVQSLSRALFGLGVRTVAMNFRGCSGEPNRKLHFYHSGDTRDLSWLVDLVARRFPGRRLGAAGFSLGGNVLLKYLGEQDDGGAGVLDGAAVMSVPYDLAAGAHLLEQSVMGRGYAGYFLRSLQRKVATKRDRLAPILDLARVDSADTIRAFDACVTAPLNGFLDADDYYARSSSRDFLDRIRTPTLLLHATDDPFLPPDCIPRERAAANPWLRLVESRRGGHVGFVEGSPWAPRFWGERAIAEFLAALLRRPATDAGIRSAPLP